VALKIITYNICEGGEDRIPQIEAVIAREEPHLVALTEANSRRKVRDLARSLDMEHFVGSARSGFHVAWLYCLPTRRIRSHNAPVLAKTLVGLEAEWEGAPLYAFATHLASRWDDTTPLAEIAFILDVVRPFLGENLVLVGDLNALAPGERVGPPPPGIGPRPGTLDGDPRPVIQRALDAGLVDCYRRMNGTAPGYTYTAEHPWLRIDYILASPSMAARLAGCDVVTSPPTDRASDHLPVSAEFR